MRLLYDIADPACTLSINEGEFGDVPKSTNDRHGLEIETGPEGEGPIPGLRTKFWTFASQSLVRLKKSDPSLPNLGRLAPEPD